MPGECPSTARSNVLMLAFCTESSAGPRATLCFANVDEALHVSRALLSAYSAFIHLGVKAVEATSI